jgi:hypothetical protein
MIRNQRGQAAIFVALMFNVLFVFFAMAINVALVVHDKINLQNSIDLATYYAAMKQAEILDVIAHENYMIRQSYKLLTWRYRVLGTMGLYRNTIHPVWSGESTESVFSPAGARPSICVTYKPTWKEVPPGENLCNQENLRIPPLPEVKVIAGFLGINQGIAALSRQLRAQFDAQCEKHGAYNWWYGMSILYAFRIDQRNRGQVINALAQNLSQGEDGDFTDLDGNSVLQGARETFLRNLTYANRTAFSSGGEFKLFNSLAGVAVDDWLPKIKIIPTVLYTDVDNNPGCFASPNPIQNLPQRPGARDLLNGNLQAGPLFQWKDDNFLQDSDYQYTIGVEKNPWYVAYVGARATTKPREIFFPLGSGVQMGARAYAKPFGGRIGPWYGVNWEASAKHSDGDPTDPLMAPRVNAGSGISSGNDTRRFPNYSRFPGDKLGLSSKLALGALNGMKTLGISFNSYQNIKADLTNGGDNDILAWDGGGAPEVRNLEIAAITPDLFDVTYYSIEPNFVENYLPRLQANRDKLKIPSSTPVRPDLGFNGSGQPRFSVQQQMELAEGKSSRRSEAFYFIRNRAHLLTAWLPAPGPFQYDVGGAMQNFGACLLADDKLKFKNPGSCVAGGRTGYSVKLVGRDSLMASGHPVGGNSTGGSLQNPPKGEGW